MEKFYQTEWQGIPFRSFATLSEHRIADKEFYAAFYEEFFRRYSDWSELAVSWRREKDHVVALIASRVDSDAQEILAVGCGLGYIEKSLVQSLPPGIELEVTEASESPLRWLRADFDSDHIFVGSFPQCLPQDKRYDLIYLSAVEYCFDRHDWVSFLEHIKARLRPKVGRCLIISASMEKHSPWMERLQFWGRAVAVRLGLRQRGQFWGYLRSVVDQRTALADAGFYKWEDGRLSDGTYWIEGRLT